MHVKRPHRSGASNGPWDVAPYFVRGAVLFENGTRASRPFRTGGVWHEDRDRRRAPWCSSSHPRAPTLPGFPAPVPSTCSTLCSGRYDVVRARGVLTVVWTTRGRCPHRVRRRQEHLESRSDGVRRARCVGSGLKRRRERGGGDESGSSSGVGSSSGGQTFPTSGGDAAAASGGGPFGPGAVAGRHDQPQVRSVDAHPSDGSAGGWLPSSELTASRRT